jgi:hypothetical protein
MLQSHEIAQLDSWLHASRGHTFVVIAGRVFGGRPGEAPQRPEAYQITPDGLLLFFGGAVEAPFVQADGSPAMLRQGGTERLVLLRPSAVSTESDGSLRIGRAEEAIFGWHYYGRPQAQENWCEDRYRLDADVVMHAVTGPIRTARGPSFPEQFPYPGDPFVRLASTP